jgi:hypothetical protein
LMVWGLFLYISLLPIGSNYSNYEKGPEEVMVLCWLFCS